MYYIERDGAADYWLIFEAHLKILCEFEEHTKKDPPGQNLHDALQWAGVLLMSLIAFTNSRQTVVDISCSHMPYWQSFGIFRIFQLICDAYKSFRICKPCRTIGDRRIQFGHI